jgi:hypothetical protein
MVIASPDSLRVQYVSDDGFYYLTLARHFVQSGHWTFDGVAAASGFHLLWAYALTFVYWLLLPSTGAFLTIALCLSIGTCLLAISLFAERANLGLWTIGALTIIMTPQWFVVNLLSGLEFSFVVLLSFAFAVSWYANANWKTVFVIAAIGVLARSDFVLLPASLAAIRIFTRRDKQSLQSAAIVLAGCVLGVLMVIFHSYATTGVFLPSNAMLKMSWGKYYILNYRLKDSFGLLTRTMGWAPSRQSLIVGFCMLVGFSSFSLFEMRKDKRLFEITLGSIAAIFAYLFAYMLGAGVGWWYASSIFVPVLFLTTIILISISHYSQPLAITMVAVLTLHSVASRTYGLENQTPFPWQNAMLGAAHFIESNKLENVAAWNAGILGYYNKGRITNLDGLVNADVVPYILNNTLYDYILMRHIRYLVDCEFQFSPQQEEIGGYYDPRFLSSIRPLDVLSHTSYGFFGAWMLYSVQGSENR